MQVCQAADKSTHLPHHHHTTHKYYIMISKKIYLQPTSQPIRLTMTENILLTVSGSGGGDAGTKDDFGSNQKNSIWNNDSWGSLDE